MEGLPRVMSDEVRIIVVYLITLCEVTLSFDLDTECLLEARERRGGRRQQSGGKVGALRIDDCANSIINSKSTNRV